MAGASATQIKAIQAITRQPREPYRAYVRRALANPIARTVKLADYAHNSDPARLARLPPEVAERLRKKYASVVDLISTAQSEHEAEHDHA